MSKKIKFDSEYKLHKLTEDNLKNLFDLELVASEIQHNNLRLDNLAFDEKTKTFVIIEYKNELNLKVLEQAQDYYNLINKYPEVYSNRLNNQSDIDFENTRVMIIGPKFTENQINNSKTNFEIWKVSLYDNGKVTYENMKTNEIKELNINLEDLESSEEKTLKNVKSEEISKLYKDFKEIVLENFNGTQLKFLNNAVSFRVNNKIVCIIRLENPVKIHYHTDELKDVENKTRDISNISTGALANYELILNSEDEIDYALDLFKQVYLEKSDKND